MSEEQLTQVSQATVAEIGSGSVFDALVVQVQATFNERMEKYGPALFETKSKGLSTVYRKAFPEEAQQHHNCSSCRTFFERFGHMVFVTPEGELVSALWDSSIAPEEYKASIEALEKLVLRSGISARFYTEHEVWGTGETAGWTHYLIAPVVNSVVLPHQVVTKVGASQTSFELLEKAVKAFTVQVAASAVNQVQAAGKALERWLPQLEWFHGFLKSLDGKNDGQVRNLVYRESATVAPSFAAIANNVEGELLLGGIANGRLPEAALRTFVMKVDPEFYRQKSAAPTEGNVTVAQRIFKELGLSDVDLGRRLASLDEVRKTWVPPVAPEAAAKEVPLFGDLVTKQAEAKVEVSQKPADGGKISWEKFKEKVLPTALEFSAYAGNVDKYIYFSAPKNPDAGRLWFYDKEEERNPFAWHTTNEPQPARFMGIVPGQLLKIVGIAVPPACWTGGERANKYMLDILLVEGLRDPRDDGSLALFAELLRPELTEAERVIQAYSLKGVMDTSTPNQAVGLDTSVARRVQVRTEFGLTDYVIDRLE
jgi:hypothetical protein